MAARKLEMNYLEAGAAYLRALEKLGLRPEILFWAYDTTVKEFVLVLTTRVFDQVGPLVLSEALFKAYNLAATPREIDPFIVRLHSPEQTVIRSLGKLLPIKFAIMPSGGSLGDEMDAPIEITGAGLQFDPKWIYRFEKTRPKTVSVLRQWQRFATSVEKLAA